MEVVVVRHYKWTTATELFILKWLILSYVSFILIFFFKKKRLFAMKIAVDVR